MPPPTPLVVVQWDFTESLSSGVIKKHCIKHLRAVHTEIHEIKTTPKNVPHVTQKACCYKYI